MVSELEMEPNIIGVSGHVGEEKKLNLYEEGHVSCISTWITNCLK
jgi:hypothetical protein